MIDLDRVKLCGESGVGHPDAHVEPGSGVTHFHVGHTRVAAEVGDWGEVTITGQQPAQLGSVAHLRRFPGRASKGPAEPGPALPAHQV